MAVEDPKLRCLFSEWATHHGWKSDGVFGDERRAVGAVLIVDRHGNDGPPSKA